MLKPFASIHRAIGPSTHEKSDRRQMQKGQEKSKMRCRDTSSLMQIVMTNIFQLSITP